MEKACELLAPVGNKEMLIAAVRSGADAVYLGLKEFSARRNAENFSLEELQGVIEYCHIRNIKVYLALNIILKQSELKNAFDLAKQAYNFGIDGVIIADLGLSSLLREKVPSLPLHASTQMTVHSASALPILKKMGFSQVVVSREMSREQIKEFCIKARENNIKVEVFVHGALCMCMSGQCLLSAFLGGRSGNRGLCAGPCRLPFKVQSGTGYDLSLKDLSLIDYLAELKAMGVYSFKIEGRMKRPEYVAAATAVCRQIIDEKKADEELKQTLKNVFSRSGFTDGYYKNELGRDMFGIRTKEDVVSAEKVFPALHQLYRAERQNVEISVIAKIKKNKPISLTLCDGQAEVTAMGDIPQAAKTKALDYENTLKSLTKFGGTPYIDIGGSLALDDGLFVSAGALNALRRDAVELLNAKRAEKKPRISSAEYNEEVLPASRKRPKLVCRFSRLDGIPEDLSGIAAVIIPLEEDAEKLPDHPNLIVDIPRGIVNEAVIEGLLRGWRQKGVKTALCGNLAAAELAKGLGFNIIADTSMNIFNSQSLKIAEEMGFKAVTLSAELSLKESDFEATLPKGIIAYGRLPLMMFKNCPVKNGKNCKECGKECSITDRMGIEFPIRCRLGFSELLNSVPIWLADRQNELTHLDFLTLFFTTETSERAAEVIKAYKKALSPDTPHTRGLYYRGVI